MSLKEKIRLRLPAYLIFSFLAFLGVVSLWLPRMVNENISEASALTYSSTSSVSRVPADSQIRLVSQGGVFYMFYTTSTFAGTTSTCGPEGGCSLRLTTSTNGASWSSPTVVYSNVALDTGDNEVPMLGNVTYNSRNGYFAVAVKNGTDNQIYVVTSTNGVTWRNGVVLTGENGGLGSISARTQIAYGTSSDFAAILYMNGPRIAIATSANPMSALSTWASTTIAGVTTTYDADMFGYLASVVGLSIDGPDKIHAVYQMVSSTLATTEYIYAYSSNRGSTWVTSSVSGVITNVGGQTGSLDNGWSGAAVSQAGRLGVFYRNVTAIDGANLTVRYFYSVQNSSETWVTSTLGTSQLTLNFAPNYYVQAPALTFFNNNNPIAFYYNSSSRPYLSINTSSFITEQVSTDEIPQASFPGVALNTSTQQLGMAYVHNYRLVFVTSTLRDTYWNVAPTTTPITPVFATSGTGYVTVTTTVTDAEADSASVYIDYSTNGGTTWASTTLVSATAGSGSVTAATGRVSGITTTATNTLSFVWDTKTDGVTATTTAMIRIAGADVYTFGNYHMSATFTVDNVALSAPAGQTVSVSTSTATFSWLDVSGVGSYTVSSTAGAASTTLSSVTSTSYTGLTPNSLYSFQVRTTDAYGNTSTYSSASSTYTDAVIPGTPTAVSAGSTSLTVSWGANSNGSGTIYNLYNVTTGASVVSTTATSYSVTGLSAATSYQFRVRAEYLANTASTTDYSATSTAATTDAASSGSSSGGGSGGSSAPAAPSLPAPAPVIPQVAQTDTFTVGDSKPISIGGTTHTVTVAKATDAQITVEIRSNPVVVTLRKGESIAINTNNDGAKDIRVEYLGLVGGKPQLKFINLTNEAESKGAFTINSGAYETNDVVVQLNFNVSGATQLAVSTDPSFAGAVFQPYQTSLAWKLAGAAGEKTLYARFRTANGGVATAQDTIMLLAKDTTSTVPPVVSNPVAPASGFQFTKNLFVGARGAEVTELQNRLKALGYFNDAATGFYGNATMVAVKKFQAANGVTQTGGVGPATRAVLNKGVAVNIPSAPVVKPPTAGFQFTKNLSIGARGADVTELQNRLKALGYFNDATTGFYGNVTAAAVKKFQAANGVTQTGGVGPATRAVLNR